MLWNLSHTITSSLPDMENVFEHRQNIRFPLMVPFWPGVAAVARCTLSKQEIQFIFIPNGYRQDLCVHNHCGYLKQTNTFLSLPPVTQFSLLNTHLLISLLTTGISHTSVLLHLMNKRKRKKEKKKVVLPCLTWLLGQKVQEKVWNLADQ